MGVSQRDLGSDVRFLDVTLLDLLDLPEPQHTGCDTEMMTVLTWAVGR